MRLSPTPPKPYDLYDLQRIPIHLTNNNLPLPLTILLSVHLVLQPIPQHVPQVGSFGVRMVADDDGFPLLRQGEGLVLREQEGIDGGKRAAGNEW
jgi:hypothetical protein